MGVCILIAAFLLSTAIIVSACMNRYYFYEDDMYKITFDKATGSYYYHGSLSDNYIMRNDVKRARESAEK
jgi:hypothetical protein